MFYCSWGMTHCRLGRSSAASTASIHNARCVLRSTLTLTTACIIGDCADNEALTPFSNPLRFLAIFNKSLITLAFTFRKLTSDHAIEWQTLKLEGVEDFPLGFLITPEEALKTTDERTRTILNHGATRGVFFTTRWWGSVDTVRSSLNEHAIAHRSVHFLSDQNTKGQAPPSVFCQALFKKRAPPKSRNLSSLLIQKIIVPSDFMKNTDLNGLRHIQMAFGWALNRAMTIFTALDWGHSRTAVLSRDATAL